MLKRKLEPLTYLIKLEKVTEKMKAKKVLIIMTQLLVVASVNAQKIDQHLTRLVEKSNTRSGNNRIILSPQAVKTADCCCLQCRRHATLYDRPLPR